MTKSSGVESPKSFASIIVVTALMLFSMFFGAGNLIFPPKLGVDSGTNFGPSITGFLLTGVALPVLAIIAIAISGNNLRDLAFRAGRIFSLGFPVIAYLSIGAFYALPRTGAVSYETGVQPIFGSDSLAVAAAFYFVFFGIALALAWNPNEIVSKLGKILTPALLILLVVLVGMSAFKFDAAPAAPIEKYSSTPFASGLVEGYLTMDSIAGLAFGIIVISALRVSGVPEGKRMVRGTMISGLFAGILLAIIYLGLGYVGQVLPNAASFDNGSGILAEASKLAMGQVGQIVFGLIVLLACMTTAVGLIAATSEFFNLLLPGISYKAWAIIFTVMSFVMATQGLSQVLAIAAPIITFIYPPAITLIALTLLDPVISYSFKLHYTYRLGVWVATIWSGISVLSGLGVGGSALADFLSLVPGQTIEFGWFLPTLAATVIGYAIDVVTRKQRANRPASVLADETVAEEVAEKA
ncbi:branched-chain amino acid transport system II carrier protein [Corynebacterium sp. MSK035]|uniref:branched-chain amino acid transport system II carrier protein n=1 Tax=Corynebacterium TaxID=1716 RepID=UPI0008A16E27|nr:MULTISPECIES: branched-chain amino acid transport system II carrier protein [Corynebacterium]KAA9245039.1 branched-chain amino acid transport system II carrier protein [Corynebacterium amycolatum]MBC6769161.1 branched-chain amino acid transport system II carrier protein [Corynebacterium sp. LK15]MBC6829702.1 branched-chain amino acid transport system II carrier protein [Corynebacterium sp. LK32]MBC6831006.1 branched-chain amino acid transport system II carrier protein [Corynebacterium sp. LK